MGISGENDGPGVRQVQFGRNMALRFSPDRPQDHIPLLSGQFEPGMPSGNMPLERRIWPEMMTMSKKRDARLLCGQRI